MSSLREPEALVRALAEERVPPEEPGLVAERREQLVAMIGRTIRESQAQQEQRSRFGKLGFALAFAASVAAAAGFSYHAVHGSTSAQAASAPAQSTSVATVRSVTGTLVMTHDGHARVVTSGERPNLFGGDELRTAADGGALVETERSAVRIEPATQVSLMAPSVIEERIRLALGRIDLKVSKQPQSPRSVVVETPNVEVVVRGTEFAVSVASEHGAPVTRVHVTEGAVWVLHGGQRELLSIGEQWSSAGDSRSAVPAVQQRSSASENTPPPMRSSTVSSPKQSQSSLAEENRLFHAALEARNRGDDRRAIELFGSLLTRYPNGHLAEEAQVERLRALRRSGDSARAAAEARHYLAAHASGIAREEARAIVLGEK